MPTTIINPPNDRVFYACQAVLFKTRTTTKSGGEDNPTSNSFLRGVQSVGINSSFDRSTYIDIGRFQREYGSYGKPVFEINIERVVGGNEPVFYTPAGIGTYEAAHILTNGNIGCDGFSDSLRSYDLTIVYGSDAKSTMDGGLSSSDVFMSTTYRCCLLTSVRYAISVDGTVKESLSFVSHVATQDSQSSGFSNLPASDPSAYPQEGAVLQKHHIDLTTADTSILPKEVKKMFDLGTTKDNVKIFGLQQIELGIDLSYSEIMNNGHWDGSDGGIKRAEQNLHRQVELPIGVTASFTGIARAQYRGDIDPGRQIFENRDGIFSKGTDTEPTVPSETPNVYKADSEIRIVGQNPSPSSTNPICWHLGQRNYLTNIDYSGGDVGGGNVEVTLSYQNDHGDFLPWGGGGIPALDNPVLPY